MITLVERHGVLTEEQCTHVIEQFRANLAPSAMSGWRGKVIAPTSRSSSSYKIPRHSFRSDIAEALCKGLADATGVLDADRVERWELVHYARGGFYRAHVDWTRPQIRRAALAPGGQRTHSAILYLAAVEKGGETAFPRLRRVVVPEIGMLLTWNNLPDGKPSYDAVHEARPVIAGEKWVLATWIRESSYDG